MTRETSLHLAKGRPLDILVSTAKRRKMIRPIPIDRDGSSKEGRGKSHPLPSIPSFSTFETFQTDDSTMPAPSPHVHLPSLPKSRPHRKTESFDFADVTSTSCVKPLRRRRFYSDADEQNFDGHAPVKEAPPRSFETEGGTFATFTACPTSTFGTSGSFMHLQDAIENDPNLRIQVPRINFVPDNANGEPDQDQEDAQFPVIELNFNEESTESHELDGLAHPLAIQRR